MTKISVVRNPANDREFARAIEELLADGVRTVEEAERRLHERWPRAVVRRRELSDEAIPVWYAYRDGRWMGAD